MLKELKELKDYYSQDGLDIWVDKSSFSVFISIGDWCENRHQIMKDIKNCCPDFSLDYDYEVGYPDNNHNWVSV